MNDIKDKYCTFTEFYFPVLPELNYHIDGNSGNQVLMITDKKEQLLITFEEGMLCMDLEENLKPSAIVRESEERLAGENKYIHQKKFLFQDDKRSDIIYFHMEIDREDGSVHTCPGQMLKLPVLRQDEGVETILIELLKGMYLCADDTGIPA